MHIATVTSESRTSILDSYIYIGMDRQEMLGGDRYVNNIDRCIKLLET